MACYHWKRRHPRRILMPNALSHLPHNDPTTHHLQPSTIMQDAMQHHEHEQHENNHKDPSTHENIPLLPSAVSSSASSFSSHHPHHTDLLSCEHKFEAMRVPEKRRKKRAILSEGAVCAQCGGTSASRWCHANAHEEVLICHICYMRNYNVHRRENKNSSNLPARAYKLQQRNRKRSSHKSSSTLPADLNLYSLDCETQSPLSPRLVSSQDFLHLALPLSPRCGAGEMPNSRVHALPHTIVDLDRSMNHAMLHTSMDHTLNSAMDPSMGQRSHQAIEQALMMPDSSMQWLGTHSMDASLSL